MRKHCHRPQPSEYIGIRFSANLLPYVRMTKENCLRYDCAKSQGNFLDPRLPCCGLLLCLSSKVPSSCCLYSGCNPGQTSLSPSPGPSTPDQTLCWSLRHPCSPDRDARDLPLHDSAARVLQESCVCFIASKSCRQQLNQ